MDDSVKAYMAKIGALGGAAGKGTKLRARLNKRAAKIRWKRHKENPPKSVIMDEMLEHRFPPNLNISPNKSPLKPSA